MFTLFLWPRRAIPIIAFHGVDSNYILVSSARLCVVYVVKEVASFPGGLGQLMGVARKERAFELQTSQEDSLAVPPTLHTRKWSGETSITHSYTLQRTVQPNQIAVFNHRLRLRDLKRLRISVHSVAPPYLF